MPTFRVCLWSTSFLYSISFMSLSFYFTSFLYSISSLFPLLYLFSFSFTLSLFFLFFIYQFIYPSFYLFLYLYVLITLALPLCTSICPCLSISLPISVFSLTLSLTLSHSLTFSLSPLLFFLCLSLSMCILYILLYHHLSFSFFRESFSKTLPLTKLSLSIFVFFLSLNLIWRHVCKLFCSNPLFCYSFSLNIYPFSSFLLLSIYISVSQYVSILIWYTLKFKPKVHIHLINI